ncbi:MAG: hypothetical protein IT537_00930 [Hyphomicrobiales bacterium]|nr:hypothetical protein [Hyphomicrobiales bacterium]
MRVRYSLRATSDLEAIHEVFYRVLAEEDVVEIVHVRHTSRRPWSGE